jgi:pyruvate,orthophosphate dikinase
MSTKSDMLCSLEYFVGTLATAYKGLVTSLIARDFCVTEGDGTAAITGTIISMPDGEYQASLMHEGKEVARSPLTSGFFALHAESALLRNARNLQIDVIQKGRHIGTFLLKKDKPDAFFTSAAELSQDLKDLDVPRLMAALQGRVGLLKNAESIIAKVFSTRKDWKKLSEEMHRFSKDLFWLDSNAHELWYPVLTRWSVAACSRLAVTGWDKSIFNLLSLIQLPLDKERDLTRLRALADMWLRSVRASSLPLSARVNDTLRVITALHMAFPDADISHVVKMLLDSLKERVSSAPALTDALIDVMRPYVTADDLARLAPYCESDKAVMLGALDSGSELLEKENCEQALERIGALDLKLLDDGEMVDLFFRVVETRLTRESSGGLSRGLADLFSVFPRLSPHAYKRAMRSTGRVIAALARHGMIDACEDLLTRTESGDSVLREEIALSPEVATAIVGTMSERLFSRYVGILTRIPIPPPGISGFSSETWAEQANPLHLERLTKFLAIIRLNSEKFRDVLIHVICSIYTSGVFIPDDKLFQREVSSYLNATSGAGNYLLHRILLKKLPVYYNEVGATGKLRDDTTEIDSWGNDTVLYFLRKQIHVNASNRNTRLVEEILSSWVGNDPESLRGAVPEDVYRGIDPQRFARYSAVIRPLFETLGIVNGSGVDFEGLLRLSEDTIREALGGSIEADEVRSKIMLLCSIYRGVVMKYSLATCGESGTSLRLSDCVEKMRGYYSTITSPEKTHPEESLFFKRHIAFGIPSVLGTYHEPKFDAFGDSLRLEAVMRLLFEEAIQKVEEAGDLPFQSDYVEWVSCLDAMNEMQKFYDLRNFQVDEIVTMLNSNALHASQVLDSLRLWQKELTWTVESLNRTFHRPLVEVLKACPSAELQRYVKEAGNADLVNGAADVIMRNLVNSIEGLVELDRMLVALIRALTRRVKAGPDELHGLDEHLGREKDFFFLHGLSDDEAMRLGPLIGNKAKNLAYLRNQGIRVPHGVVFSARWTAEHERYTGGERFRAALREAVAKIETVTPLRFGDATMPLFLSVRSGSYVSMPGILSSILYCGMNEETLEGLTRMTGDTTLGWDSYRRFIEHYASVVLDLDVMILESALVNFMKRAAVAKREDLTGDHLSDVVTVYKKELSARNLEIPADVYEQLSQAVKAVYRSWFGEKARLFRRAMGISDHWGTSVTLMQMIHGNKEGAGASVFFTRNPVSLERGIYGDTREVATGDDLVYGRLVNRPIRREHALAHQKSLELVDPQLFLLHEEVAERIERAMRGLPQEVEATYTREADGKRVMHVLQTRRMEVHRGFTRRFDDICRMESRIIAHGVGVHGGALSGIATFSESPEHIRRTKDVSSLPVILLRGVASTQDVSLMPDIDGILTATGGATSHAAILAEKFDITAVVGCADMQVAPDEKGEPCAQIGEHLVREGSHISIDGSTGLVYAGLCAHLTRSVC